MGRDRINVEQNEVVRSIRPKMKIKTHQDQLEQSRQQAKENGETYDGKVTTESLAKFNRSEKASNEESDTGPEHGEVEVTPSTVLLRARPKLWLMLAHLW